MGWALHPLLLIFKMVTDKSWSIGMQARGPHEHILMTGGGPSDFFGSEILAKSVFFGSMEDAGIFLGHEKKNRGIFLGCEKRTKGFFRYAKDSSDFFVDKF